MNKSFIIVVLSLFLMAIISCSSINGALAAEDKPIKLLFGTFDPPVAQWGGVTKEWAEDLEKRTNGRVEVTISWAGALGKGPDYYEICKKGVADAVQLQPGMVPGLFPMSDIMSLPWIIDTAEIGGKALIEFAKKGYLDKEYGDVKVLFFFTGVGDPIFSNKPVKTLQDMKGLKLFTAGPAASMRIQLMGGVPTFLASAMDVYPSMQKGIIDGVVLPWPIVNAFRLFPLAKNVTVPGVGTIAVSFIMNKDYYNRLPGDIQKVIDEMSWEHAMKFAAAFDKGCEIGKNDFEKVGGHVHQWSPEAIAEIEKIYAGIWTHWITETEKKGFPAKKAVDDFYNILKSLGVEKPAIGYTPDN